MKRGVVVVGILLSALAPARPACAGGAWVPAPGNGYIQLGFSRKTASSSWDAQGHSFVNDSYHDFRYAYLSGEVGLMKNLSGNFLFTYLYGLEGPHNDEEKNAGLSDAWLGLKYQVHHGDLPMAVSFTYRTPFFYDLPGAYSRYLYNRDGSIRSTSPEWRGILKHDYTLMYLVSHSFDDSKGWWDVEFGYVWREGAPADQFPLWVEAGHSLPWLGAQAKLFAQCIRSRGNNTPHEPDDRFGDSPTFSFNRGSMARVGGSVIVPISTVHRWSIEAGYNQWVWGRSARQYREPFLSVGHTF